MPIPLTLTRRALAPLLAGALLAPALPQAAPRLADGWVLAPDDLSPRDDR